MKKVAVFGGSGFLGTYLVNELLKRNYDVHSFDLNPPTDDSGVKFTKLDILDRTKISDAFAALKFDIVYNLAGFANLDKAVEFPVETVQLNVMGNLYILDECRKHQVSRYVYASSAYDMSDKGTFYGIS
ncbi:MAG: NAD-dependent epimerase/dehydratase family protein, partial [Crocinitomicaceae bacterium]|nr:NAD-dependent epimerase/dehydratase family protein [Crocinitomicaceae bacterium]